MRSGAQMLASWRWLRVHAAFHPERLHWFRLYYCQVSQVVKEVSSDCACRCFRPMASLPPNVPFAPRCAPQFFCLWFWWGVCRCARQYQDMSGSCAGGTQQVLIFCLVWQPSRSILITWRWFVKRDTVTHRTYQMLCQSLWQHVHVGDAVNRGWADNLIDYARE